MNETMILLFMRCVPIHKIIQTMSHKIMYLSRVLQYITIKWQRLHGTKQTHNSWSRRVIPSTYTPLFSFMTICSMPTQLDYNFGLYDGKIIRKIDTLLWI